MFNPAFPNTQIHEMSDHEKGLSKLDYFAGLAMCGMLAGKSYNPESMLTIARQAYNLASIMIDTRDTFDHNEHADEKAD